MSTPDLSPVFSKTKPFPARLFPVLMEAIEIVLFEIRTKSTPDLEKLIKYWFTEYNHEAVNNFLGMFSQSLHEKLAQKAFSIPLNEDDFISVLQMLHTPLVDLLIVFHTARDPLPYKEIKRSPLDTESKDFYEYWHSAKSLLYEMKFTVSPLQQMIEELISIIQNGLLLANPIISDDLTCVKHGSSFIATDKCENKIFFPTVGRFTEYEELMSNMLNSFCCDTTKEFAWHLVKCWHYKVRHDLWHKTFIPETDKIISVNKIASTVICLSMMHYTDNFVAKLDKFINFHPLSQATYFLETNFLPIIKLTKFIWEMHNRQLDYIPAELQIEAKNLVHKFSEIVSVFDHFQYMKQYYSELFPTVSEAAGIEPDAFLSFITGSIMNIFQGYEDEFMQLLHSINVTNEARVRILKADHQGILIPSIQHYLQKVHPAFIREVDLRTELTCEVILRIQTYFLIHKIAPGISQSPHFCSNLEQVVEKIFTCNREELFSKLNAIAKLDLANETLEPFKKFFPEIEISQTIVRIIMTFFACDPTLKNPNLFNDAFTSYGQWLQQDPRNNPAIWSIHAFLEKISDPDKGKLIQHLFQAGITPDTSAFNMLLESKNIGKYSSDTFLQKMLDASRLFNYKSLVFFKSFFPGLKLSEIIARCIMIYIKYIEYSSDTWTSNTLNSLLDLYKNWLQQDPENNSVALPMLIFLEKISDPDKGKLIQHLLQNGITPNNHLFDMLAQCDVSLVLDKNFITNTIDIISRLDKNDHERTYKLTSKLIDCKSRISLGKLPAVTYFDVKKISEETFNLSENSISDIQNIIRAPYLQYLFSDLVEKYKGLQADIEKLRSKMTSLIKCDSVQIVAFDICIAAVEQLSLLLSTCAKTGQSIELYIRQLLKTLAVSSLADTKPIIALYSIVIKIFIKETYPTPSPSAAYYRLMACLEEYITQNPAGIKSLVLAFQELMRIYYYKSFNIFLDRVNALITLTEKKKYTIPPFIVASAFTMLEIMHNDGCSSANMIQIALGADNPIATTIEICKGTLGTKTANLDLPTVFLMSLIIITLLREIPESRTAPANVLAKIGMYGTSCKTKEGKVIHSAYELDGATIENLRKVALPAAQP